MATRNKTYKPPKRWKTVEGELQLIYEHASMGLREATIARKLGYEYSDFTKLLGSRVNGELIFQNAYLDGVAEFEHVNAQTLMEVLEDPETSEGTKVKIARDNLKAKFEEWAPAVRAMKVVVEDKATEFSFEDFTQNELEAIAEQSAEKDTPTLDDAEE